MSNHTPTQKLTPLLSSRSEFCREVELERAQRNLARLQRIGDKHGALVACQKIVLDWISAWFQVYTGSLRS